MTSLFEMISHTHSEPRSVVEEQHRLFCNVYGNMSVYPCGRWNREAGYNQTFK
jgi:hypothetical protein